MLQIGSIKACYIPYTPTYHAIVSSFVLKQGVLESPNGGSVLGH